MDYPVIKLPKPRKIKREKKPQLSINLRLSYTERLASRLGRNSRWGRTCADTGFDWQLLEPTPVPQGKPIDPEFRRQVEELTRDAEIDGEKVLKAFSS